MRFGGCCHRFRIGFLRLWRHLLLGDVAVEHRHDEEREGRTDNQPGKDHQPHGVARGRPRTRRRDERHHTQRHRRRRHEDRAETHAGGYVLRNLWKDHYPTEPFCEIFQRHSENPIIQTFIEAMAIPFATELNLFDPDQVILGGGVVEMAGFPMERLLGYVREFVRKPYPGEDFTLLRASSAPETGVAGAAYYAMERLAGDFLKIEGGKA